MYKRHNHLTAEYVRSILDYDPETGIFRWRIQRGNANPPAGAVAGKLFRVPKATKFRRLISIDKRGYYANRLAWLIMTGDWPELDVDHKDTDSENDRWANLRLATISQNCFNRGAPSNNTSGIKGVSWVKKDRVWRARIGINGKEIWLGSFDNPHDAAEAYRTAAMKHGGEFFRP